jgi:arylsulfatase A-like enzyme
MQPTKLGLLITAFAGMIGAAAAKESAPNILYIFTDDQSFRTVSCYPGAYNYADTPNIDRLAEQGVRFDNAYVGAK